MRITDRQVLALSVLFVTLLLAGCAQLTVHSTVGADGTIEEYQLQINTSRQVYGFLEQGAEEEGYDSLRESFLAGVNESHASNIEYDEEFNGDTVSITIRAEDFQPPADSNLSIAEEDGMLVYEDLTFVDEAAQAEAGNDSELARTMTAGLSVDYYLTMPGDIVESNADEVDGNTAEWHESGSDAFTDNRIYATSEVSTGVSLPGFGMGVAVLAIVLVVLAGVYRIKLGR